MKPMICETSIEPRWDEVWGVELYSHKGDEANDFGKRQHDSRSLSFSFVIVS